MQGAIFDYVSGLTTINTHSHFRDDDFFTDFSLTQLLENTYISWSGVPIGTTRDERAAYFAKVRYKSYFIWLQKSLKAIYGIQQDLDADTWDIYDTAIKKAHAIPNLRYELLSKACKYEKVIMDAYWNPGYRCDNDIFLSTFRVDPFFFGHNKDATTHDNTSMLSLYNRHFNSLDGVVGFMDQTISQSIYGGSVALKCAIAYTRDLHFERMDKVTAQKVFNYNHTVKEHIYNYQSFIMYELCSIAAALKVPLQIHTGLGCMDNTNAAQLNTLIRDNPDTTFVLFHGSYPWTDDIIGLLHSYSNVYADTCWLPLLSPKAAVYTLHQMIDVATADKITWGCDTWTLEESYGARLAMNEVLSTVLLERIESGYLDMDGAKTLAENIMRNNAKKLYKL